MKYEELEREIKTKEKRGNMLFVVLSIIWIIVTLFLFLFSKRPFVIPMIINIILTSFYFIYAFYYYFTVLREIKSYNKMFDSIKNGIKETRILEYKESKIITNEGLKLNKYIFKNLDGEIDLLSPFDVKFDNKKYKVETIGRFIKEYHEEVF